MQKGPIASLLTATFLVVGHGCSKSLHSEATGGSGPRGGSQVLALSYWPPGCFVMASPDRSQVMMPLEAWEDSECSRGTNTMVTSRRMDFLKTSSLTSDSGLHGVTQVVGEDFPKVLCSSAGAVTGSGAQVVPALVVGSQERASAGDSCHLLRLMETSVRNLLCMAGPGGC